MVLGALEAGGTKMVCAIGNEKGEILEQISIPTETPEITVPKLLSFFKGKEIEALGIGCFGRRSSRGRTVISWAPLRGNWVCP